MDHHDPVHALLLAGTRIVHRIALTNLATVNAEENQLTSEGVGPQLKCERTKWRIIVGGKFRNLSFIIRIGAGLHIHVQRRRQIIDHGIDHRLYALILEGGAAQDRYDFTRNSQATDGLLELSGVGRLVLEEHFHDLLITVAYRFE